MDYEEYRALEKDYHERFRRYNRRKLSMLKKYFRWYHRLEVSGLEHVPDGPALIAANHGGGYDLDIMALGWCTLPDRPVHVLIAADWHFISSSWGRYFVGSGIPLWLKGGIRWDYIDPYLKAGGDRYPGLVAIFPEGNSGTFFRRHRLGTFFPGVVRLALRYRVPIVPVAMAGFHKASPILAEITKGYDIPLPVVFPLTVPVKLRVVIGRSFELSEYYGRNLSREEEGRVANEVLRPKIAALLGRYQKTLI